MVGREYAGLVTVQRLWRAVLHRDARADGLFVYGVTSTRVYCRPSCGSRRPKRSRVEFFPTPAMAEAQGYRACRRCRPAAPKAPCRTAEFVRRVCEAVSRHPEHRWTSAALASAGGTSIARLQRGFRRTLGIAPRDYVAACRRRRFLDALRKGRPVTDAVYEAGYGSPSRVYEHTGTVGMTPATYGRGGAGASIRWATVRTRIGRVLVAATERGVCFVSIGATSRQLVNALREEFPRAEIAARASASLAPALDAVRLVAEGQRPSEQLPFDILGTAFQWRVWQALAEIPGGERRTYGEVAASIGSPRGARAVARACATNPAALLIPCHRVVSADGSVGGYRWGRGVKEKLLEEERD